MPKRVRNATAAGEISETEIQGNTPPADLILKTEFPEKFQPPPSLPPVITRYDSGHLGRSDIISRAVSYLAKMPPAVSGSGGHNACYRVACVLRVDFDLTVEESLEAIREWNADCEPPWSEHELRHKLDEAGKASGERGRLLRQDAYSFQPVYRPDRNVEQRDTAEPKHWSEYFDAVPADQFDAMEFPLTWIVEGVMVQGDPVICGGPRKALKTTMLVELGIAIATGTPFLNRYAVPEKRNVWMFSGESGGRVIQETCRRVAQSRGIPFRDLCNAFRTDVVKIPELRSVLYVDAMVEFIKQHDVNVVIVDPSYLAIPLAADEQANISAVGVLLQNSLTRIRNETGCTPILASHFRKHMRTGDIPDMSDIAGAGFDAWGRQFLLLNRVTAHDAENPGHHDLILKWGGSAGHQGQAVVIVDEGTIEAGRTWHVELATLDEFKQGRKGERQDAKDDARHNKNRPRIFNAIRILNEQGKPATQTAIGRFLREETPMVQPADLRADLERMVQCDDLRQETEGRNTVFSEVTPDMRLSDTGPGNLVDYWP